MDPSLAFLPEEFHGQRSLVGYSPWGHKNWDTTEHLSTTYYLVYTYRMILLLTWWKIIEYY